MASITLIEDSAGRQWLDQTRHLSELDERARVQSLAQFYNALFSPAAAWLNYI